MNLIEFRASDRTQYYIREELFEGVMETEEGLVFVFFNGVSYRTMNTVQHIKDQL